MNRSTDPKVAQEALHHTKADGSLSKRFNALTGKWETVGPSQQELAFDSESGKLLVKRTNAPVNNVDSVLAIPMAAAGFFMFTGVIWTDGTVGMDNGKI
jgi:hypothetical protein